MWVNLSIEKILFFSLISLFLFVFNQIISIFMVNSIFFLSYAEIFFLNNSKKNERLTCRQKCLSKNNFYRQFWLIHNNEFFKQIFFFWFLIWPNFQVDNFNVWIYLSLIHLLSFANLKKNIQFITCFNGLHAVTKFQ